MDPTLAITPGQLALDASFDSIGVELRFTGDSNANATAALAFRKTGAADWIQAFPLWPNNDGSVAAFDGAVLQLEPGASYDVQVTLADADGSNGGTVLDGSIVTRSDSPQPADQLVPTHYVRAGGSDSNDGLTEATAWASVRKAWTAAPAGAIVQVGPGYFQRPTSQRTQPITLVAQYPATDDTGTPINAGQHSVIDPDLVTTPGQALWQPIDQVGPVSGQSERIYKWSAAPIGFDTRIIAGYTSDRAQAPRRIQMWDRDTHTATDKTGKVWSMNDPANWTDTLYNNGSYTFGLAVFPSVDKSHRDLYLRLPGDVDPNTVFVDLGYSPPGNSQNMTLGTSDSRISGLEIRQQHIPLAGSANRDVFDHNLLVGSEITPNAAGSAYPTDDVVEHNRFADTNLSGDDLTDPELIPWKFVKQWTVLGDGTQTPWWRTGQESETHGIAGTGGFNRVVVRNNVFDGGFNGISGQTQQPSSRDDKREYNVTDNIFQHIADDPLEPDTGAIGWIIARNRFEQTSTVLSTAPLLYGPLYYFDNIAWNFGPHVRADVTGDQGGGDYGFKYSGKSYPPARVYVLHNTFWTDWTGGNAGGVSGGELGAGGGSASPEHFYLRDNLFRVTNHGFSVHAAGADWDEDYDVFEGDGVKVQSTVYPDPAQYRTVTGGGLHTNLNSDFTTASAIDSQLVDPLNGDLRLQSDSLLASAGTPIPNLDDPASMSITLGAR